jgi:hypothetical protein
MGNTTTQEIFHASLNRTCSCVRRITYAQRDAALGLGEIYILAHENREGVWIPDWSEIILIGRRDRPPRSPTITDHHIAAAFVEQSEFARLRIERYGQLEMLEEKFVQLVKVEPERNREPDLSIRFE